MDDIRKLKAIVAREFLERVRTKWFVIITLLGPVLLSAILFLPLWLASRDSASSKSPGLVLVLDATGSDVGQRLRDALGAPATGMPNVLASTARQTVPVSVQTLAPGDLAAAESSATKAVISKSAAGYLVLGPRIFEGDSARYTGRNVTSVGDMARLSGAMRQALLAAQLRRAGVADTSVMSIVKRRTELVTERLTERGRGGSGEANVMFAFGVSFLLYMAIVLYGQNVLRGVLEEKQTRVAEVVLSSVQPSTLLAGKVIGVGAVGLVQILAWIAGTALVGAYFSPLIAGGAGAGAGPAASMRGFDFSIGGAAAILLFFLLGYTFYSSLYAAAGSMVNDEREAQQVLQPLLLPLVATALMIQPVLLNPTGGLARGAALFPLSAPVIMPLRLSITPVPWWEVALSAGLLVVSCVGAVWVAARIYRVGLLMYGKRPTVREMARWVREAA